MKFPSGLEPAAVRFAELYSSGAYLQPWWHLYHRVCMNDVILCDSGVCQMQHSFVSIIIVHPLQSVVILFPNANEFGYSQGSKQLTVQRSLILIFKLIISPLGLMTLLMTPSVCQNIRHYLFLAKGLICSSGCSANKI
jgi:hypothetical protein